MEIECLVDTRNHFPEVRNLFSRLRKLRIESMKHLGALYHGVPPSCLFEKLEQLYITDCPVLTCLFTPKVARSLVWLEKLLISSCDELKHLLADNDTEDEEISRRDHGLVFSKLKTININNCKMMEYIIPITYAPGLVQLKSLVIRDCHELKFVFGQCTRGDKIQNEIELPALEELDLYANFKMMSIFPSNCSATWPPLHDFELSSCPKFDIMSINTFKASSLKISRFQDTSAIEKYFLTSKCLSIYNNSKIESIFNLDGLQNSGKPVNLQLQSVDLWYVDQMKYICMGAKDSFTFQNLKSLLIKECDKLEVVFPASVLRFLPELQLLEISDCQELKQVIEEDYVENQKLSDLVSSPPCFPKLVALVIRQCHNLKRLLGVSSSKDLPNLEFLIIMGAEKLEDLMGCEQGQVDDIGKVKVELPTLNVLVLLDLPNLCQGIELPTPTTRVVHSCPKLPLPSSIVTLEEFGVKMETYRDRVLPYLFHMVYAIVNGAIESRQVFTLGDTGFENPEGSIVQKPLPEIESTVEIPKTETKLSKIDTYTDKEDDDPISSFQHVEEEDVEVTHDSPTTEDNLVAKVIADLEEYLKIPLKDIASSKGNSLQILTGLKFLYHISLEDITLSGELKAIIDSLHREFPRILRSFEQAFAVTRKFKALEENERSIKEQMVNLEKEIKECEADLSSLQEEKKKCIELKKELENVGREKSQMMEDQRKAQQKLLEVNYKWSALCSQFELI